MELFGVKFAPLRVPIERRLQTFAAAAWICILTTGGPIGYLITAYILIFTKWLRYIMLIYLIWVYYDRDTCRRGGRGKAWTNWMRNCAWWRYYCSYFPIKLVKTADLDPARNYLFCAFPHGILSTGAFGAFATDILGFDELFPGMESRLVTLDLHFHVPLFREFVYSLGVCSSSAESLNYLLSDRKTSPVDVNSLEGEDKKSTGKAVVLIVGGAAESLRCKPGRYNIILRRRKGFVRIALKNGSPMIPVISFGETDLYDQIVAAEGSILSRTQQLFRKVTGIAPVLAIGRGFFQYTFGVVPKRKPVTVVVGSPMEVPKIPEPTTEQIEEYHTKFKNKLIDFFETEKYNYIADPEGISLTIE
ncbi:2-acylglycerol O-acyltransferase 2-like isoform X2 [Venturia canescens]|nr:2-acylglycerol O-acyltransferase 2-like isoform X2 [Venturia canescens]